MTTFGLVHGAYHGSWCWSALSAELEARGHRALTVDLPCEDPDAGANEYADVAVAAFRDAPDDVVLVGHSLAGLTIPLVAQRRPVARMVFVCAMLPRIGRSGDEVMQTESDMIGAPPLPGRSHLDERGATSWEPEAAAAWFFDDCEEVVAEWAAAQLRPQCWRITEEVTPLRAWPSTPSVAVIGSRDPVVRPVWSRRISPEVLGVAPVELDCGHSPFLSAPEALAVVLTTATVPDGGDRGRARP